jgi:hypothetical protein
MVLSLMALTSFGVNVFGISTNRSPATRSKNGESAADAQKKKDAEGRAIEDRRIAAEASRKRGAEPSKLLSPVSCGNGFPSVAVMK